MKSAEELAIISKKLFAVLEDENINSEFELIMIATMFTKTITRYLDKKIEELK